MGYHIGKNGTGVRRGPSAGWRGARHGGGAGAAAGPRAHEDARAAVAGLARRRGVPLASHDDESQAAVRRAHGLGAAISEFPINLEAAAAARAFGMKVAMGAPNARSGRSNHGNGSARDR